RVTVWGGGPAKVFADHQARVFALAFTPAGDRLVSGGEDPYLFVWDPNRDQRVGQLGEAGGTVRAIAISRDGKTVAAVANGAIHRWDLASGKKLGTVSAVDFG